MKKTLFTGAIIAASLALTPATSFSAGGDDAPVVKTPTCKKGYVYSKRTKKCVRKKSMIFPDADLKQQGWALAYAGKYQTAISLFDLVANKSDPEALNGLGFSNRKLGRLENGISYYKKALAINPDYHLAREYLGEGFVAAGRVNLAKMQLAQIKMRCGTTCKEYTMLSKVIQTGGSSNW